MLNLPFQYDLSMANFHKDVPHCWQACRSPEDATASHLTKMKLTAWTQLPKGDARVQRMLMPGVAPQLRAACRHSSSAPGSSAATPPPSAPPVQPCSNLNLHQASAGPRMLLGHSYFLYWCAMNFFLLVLKRF